MDYSKEELFKPCSPSEFEQRALYIFRKQAIENPVYRFYLSHLQVDAQQVDQLKDIPFLPIEFFKTKTILLDGLSSEIVFSSSGTTGMQQSKHPVSDIRYYEWSYRLAFQYFYGDIQDYALLALLPSYQEREGSSLIYMVDDLIQQARPKFSGYFLYNHDALYERLLYLHKEQIPTLLIGVTYALLDFIENYTVDFPELIVMETGGMKGKRKEMIREELHQALCKGFGVHKIHSEYGMTELLSQAYSKGQGLFRCPPWMKVFSRDINDPLSILGAEQTGGINIIDLANIHSCSFIATQDLGKVYPDGSFEILGRFDESDIRGCNLLVQ
ncbi:acyltransferase [Olivibacter ginsenosidimutans]|uniref:Acyltransferase n=1 Tax=Olivibacter ginsenosidimutans TaxID=1176537 RepID=A0ABP9BNA5_9SPHI